MLRARDSALTVKLVALAGKQHFVRIHFTAPSVRNLQALSGFQALGSEAKDAVPALLKIFEADTSPDSRRSAALALGYIGPDARAAVPFLLAAVSDTNASGQNISRVRSGAVFALGGIHADPQLVVPVLTKALNDEDYSVQDQAMWALGHFGADAKAALPELLQVLNGSNWALAFNAAIVITNVDPDAAVLRKAELDAARATGMKHIGRIPDAAR